MNYANLFGFRALVTFQWHFEKDNYTKIRTRVRPTYAVYTDYIEAWGKRLLLACTEGAGGWYETLQIIWNLLLHTFRFFCDPQGYAQSRELSKTTGWLFSRLLFRGLTYRHKAESGAVYQVSSRSSVSGPILCTASITESGLSYNLREVTPYQKITAMLCVLSPVPEYVEIIVGL